MKQTGQCPHQGNSKALASIFHNTPHGERRYQLPQDSNGHAVRTWLCCNSGSPPDRPTPCVTSHMKNLLFHKQSSTQHLTKRLKVSKHTQRREANSVVTAHLVCEPVREDGSVCNEPSGSLKAEAEDSHCSYSSHWIQSLVL